MKTHRFLFTSALAYALLIPALASAQTPVPTPNNGTITGSGASAPGTSGQPKHHGFGMHRLMQGITLTDAQQQQVDQLIQQFHQAHQPGTTRDPQAMQNLRTSIENVLTPTQRTQFENNIAQMRANFQKNHPNPSPNPS